MKPNIVIADGHTTNPGDLSWQGLAALGQLTVFARSGDALLHNCAGARIVLTNKERFDAEVLRQLPELEFVSVLATGTNVVDLKAAKDSGIVVSNVPRYSTASVAEHVFALLLELEHRVTAHTEAARGGDWSRSGDFSYRLGPIHELCGKALGIVGLGAIGSAVARIGSALGMTILAAKRPSRPTFDLPGIPIRWLSLDELFARADVVTLHCPLTPETKHLVDGERLRLMKPEALVINTGRGPLVDEAALCAALHAGQLRGAGVDVLSNEPPEPDNPLFDAPRCLVTPHLAWATVEARRRLIDVTVENVAAFLRSSPQNVVGL